MIRFVFICLIGFTLLANAAYTPLPVQRSAAEVTLKSTLDAAKTDSEKVVIAKTAIEANPDDARIGETAGLVLRKYLTDAEKYLKLRTQEHESIASRFVFAYYYGDSAEQLATSEWILKKDPNNFWGHRLAADAEWSKSNPALTKVRSELEAALAADPSQPEGYYELGSLFEEMDKIDDALSVYEAGAVCDPAHALIRASRMAIYANQHKADQYFALLPDVLPKDPVNVTLKSAIGKDDLTPEVLKNKITVLEFWGFS